MGLRDQLRRLRERAGKDAVILEQRDGSRRYFSELDAFKETFLAQCDLFRGEPPKDSSGVIAAVLGATDQSRREFEQRFEQVVGMEVHIVGPDWVEAHTLIEDGTVETTRHEGEEAERKKADVRGVEDLSE